MIALAGAAHRSFVFPARLLETCAFYQDVGRQLDFLTHIRKVKTYAPDRFRVMYNCVEPGNVHVRIYCDVQARYEPQRRRLTLRPIAELPPVAPRVTLRSIVAQGQFASETTFRPAGTRTRVEFHMTLNARLPKPWVLGLVPDAVLEHVALEITHRRVDEIAGRFTERSIQAYRDEVARTPAALRRRVRPAPRPRG